MLEGDEHKQPQESENSSPNEVAENPTDAQSVLDSTVDKRQVGSGTDILKENELDAVRVEPEQELLSPEGLPALEPVGSDSNVEIESFVVEAEDSGLELPEDECLGLQPAVNAQVISETHGVTCPVQNVEIPPANAEDEIAVSEPGEAPIESSAVGTEHETYEAPASAEEESSAVTPVAVEETSEADVLMVRVPGDERWFPLSELIVQSTGEAFGESAARWMTRLYQQSLESSSQAEETAAEESAPAVSFPQIETTAESTDYRERLKKTGPKKSLIKELAGIVLGGAGGLLIAYYALNWFGGPRYDFAKLPLPGIHHTYKHAPSWLRDVLEGKFWPSESQETDEINQANR
ncbi:MAG: hypothetical protein ACUVQR_14805 [Thermogutta sp.]